MPAQHSTGWLVRVRWQDGAPSITLPWPRLPLIAMGAPTIHQRSAHHAISVPICGGLLAEPGGRSGIRSKGFSDIGLG